MRILAKLSCVAMASCPAIYELEEGDMKILAKLSCDLGVSCPTVADPEDGSGNLIVIGRRISGHYPDLIGTGEEAIVLSEELLARAGYVKKDTRLHNDCDVGACCACDWDRRTGKAAE